MVHVELAKLFVVRNECMAVAPPLYSCFGILGSTIYSFSFGEGGCVGALITIDFAEYAAAAAAAARFRFRERMTATIAAIVIRPATIPPAMMPIIT